jgi:hypothetical protein
VTFNQHIYARVATTDNGWTSDNVCLNWFTRVFVPQAKAHADSSKPIVLMYDRHGLHVTYEMIDAAWKSNVILFCLPPHTTHKLQPCDVGAFSPLKCAWEARCDVYLQENGIPLQAHDVVQEYMEGLQLMNNLPIQTFLK